MGVCEEGDGDVEGDVEDDVDVGGGGVRDVLGLSGMVALMKMRSEVGIRVVVEEDGVGVVVLAFGEVGVEGRVGRGEDGRPVLVGRGWGDIASVVGGFSCVGLVCCLLYG